MQDEGIGISHGEQAQIFKPFFQTNDEFSRNLNSNSNGIGLNLSLKLARLLQGNLTVQSDLGQGSLFILHLGQMSSEIEYFEKI